MNQKTECPLCKGRGSYGTPGARCEFCDGKGAAPPAPEAQASSLRLAPEDAQLKKLIYAQLPDLDVSYDVPSVADLLSISRQAFFLGARAAQQPAPEAQAEPPHNMTIKRDEWGALSPEAQSVIRDATKARALKNAQGAASIRDVPLFKAQQPAPEAQPLVMLSDDEIDGVWYETHAKHGYTSPRLLMRAAITAFCARNGLVVIEGAKHE